MLSFYRLTVHSADPLELGKEIPRNTGNLHPDAANGTRFMVPDAANGTRFMVPDAANGTRFLFRSYPWVEGWEMCGSLNRGNKRTRLRSGRIFSLEP